MLPIPAVFRSAFARNAYFRRERSSEFRRGLVPSCAGLSICGRKSSTFRLRRDARGANVNTENSFSFRRGTLVSLPFTIIRDIFAARPRFDSVPIEKRDHWILGCNRISFVQFRFTVRRRNDKFSSQLPRPRHLDPPTCRTEIILSDPDLSPNVQHYRDSPRACKICAQNEYRAVCPVW